MAIRCIRRFVDESRGKLIPLVAAPSIGEVGERLCEEAEIGWLDLSGNARLVAPSLRAKIEGKPNRFDSPAAHPDPTSIDPFAKDRGIPWKLEERLEDLV